MRNCRKKPCRLILVALLLDILLSMKLESVNKPLVDVVSLIFEDFYPNLEIKLEIHENKNIIYEQLTGEIPPTSFKFSTSNIPLEKKLLESVIKKNKPKTEGKIKKPTKANEKGKQRTLEERLVSKESQAQVSTENRDLKTMTRDERQTVRNEMKKLISQMFSLGSLDKNTEYYDFLISVELPPKYLDRVSINLDESTPKLEVKVNEQGVLLGIQTLIFKITDLKVEGSVIGEFIKKGKSKNVDLNGSVVIKSLEVFVVISNYRQGGFPDISFEVTELVIEEVKVNEGNTNQSWMAMAASFLPTGLLGLAVEWKKKLIEKVIVDYFEWYREYAKEKFEKMSVQKKDLMFWNGIMYDEVAKIVILNLGNLNRKSEIVVTETTFTQITMANRIFTKLIY